MRNFLVAISILFSMLGCSMQQEMEVVLPAQEPVILVEFYLSPDQPLKAVATRSVGFFDDLELVHANDLRVRVNHKGQEYPLTQVTFVDSIQRAAYNYISIEDTVRYAEGDTWEMVVRKGEEEIARGSTRFLPKPQIKEVDYSVSEDSIISLSIKLADPPEQQNYYRVMLFQPGSPPWGHFDGIWTDQFSQNGELTIHIGPHVKLGGATLVVQVDHLEEGYYNFLHSLDKASNSNYNPFAQPANIESTLEGKAVGVFTAISRTTEQLQIDYSR